MKLIKYTCLLALVLFFMSCSKDDVTPENTDETKGLTLVKTFSNAAHNIAVFTERGKLQQGYNKIYLQIKNVDGSLVTNATASWKPLMHMMGMQHACPYSTIQKAANKQSLYEGYIVFQMAGNEMEYWELTIDYSINGTNYTVTDKVDVIAAATRNVESFKGTDNVNYVLALVAPTNPKVALNNMEALVFKMENLMSFPVVNNYKIKIDPRMPGMANHGSPNNVDLMQWANDAMYHGKLSLTMTGYWKINLQLENAAGEILNGEPVTGTNESSSIFFEVAF